ncbi:MAG: RES family NAD+ phosphorylase [Gemmatimonadota bacterium]
MAPTPDPGPFWRVFPWNPEARPGAPFSSRHVPRIQGSGRFDLPGGCLYLAETGDHPVAEKIQRYRGRSIGPQHLIEFGHPLALVEVSLASRVRARVADLCDPEVLQRHGIQPDRTAARGIRTTQAIARSLHETGASGLRWWSAFFGEWHTLVLFADRFSASDLSLGLPTALDLQSPVLVQAAAAIGVRIRGE